VANLFQFDENPQSRTPLCLACEEMLTDAVDQTLSPADQAWFDKHVAGCVDCAQMVADAQRGAAWLELLKSPRPEPSAQLMERIIAQTSGTEAADFAPVVIGQPAVLPVAAPSPQRANLLAFRVRMPRFASFANANFQPRLAMTAAMAFFSIALTLNLSGVRLDQLHASSLKPSNVKRTYYEASADAVRYYDNLRVVRVLESRVDDLRAANSDLQRDDTPAAPAPAPQQPQEQSTPSTDKPAPKQPDNNGGGMTRRESPLPVPLSDRPRFVNTNSINTPKSTRKGGLA
jgi:hypothetical protein